MPGLRRVMTRVNFADQLLFWGAKLVVSGAAERRHGDPKEAAVEEGGDPLGRLVTEMGRAARAGWAQTARLMALLAVVAAAVALVLMTSR